MLRSPALWLWFVVAIGGAAFGYLAVEASDRTLLTFIGLPLFAVTLLRLCLPPRGVELTPARVFLPIYAAYFLTSVYLADPDTSRTQLIAFAWFVAAFFLASHLVPPGTPTRRDEGPYIPRGLLHFAELGGLAIYAYVFARHGVPILAGGGLSATRVELAESVSIGTFGTVLLHLSIICDLLVRSGRATLGAGPRRNHLLHVAIATAPLVASAVRTDVLMPFAIFGVFLTMTNWRKVMASIIVVVIAAGFFLGVANLRDSGTHAGYGPLGPLYSYTMGTANTTDRIINGTASGRLTQQHPYFLWIYYRKIKGDKSVEPPGIALANAYGARFEGFGFAIGAIGAFWLDLGAKGPLIGGLILGALAGLAYRAWRTRGRWWAVVYAYTVVALLFSAVQHPLSSYYQLVMPVALIVIAFLAPKSPRERSHGQATPVRQRPKVHAA